MPELLAPAGNLEKLVTAIHYGADAVYLGGKDLSLRAKAGNFSTEDLQKGVSFAHEHGRKVPAGRVAADMDGVRVAAVFAASKNAP